MNGTLDFQYHPDTSVKICDFIQYQDTIYLLVCDTIYKVVKLDANGNPVSEFVADTSTWQYWNSFSPPFIHLRNARIYTIFSYPINKTKCFDLNGNILWTHQAISGDLYNLAISADNKCAMMSFGSYFASGWDWWKTYVTLVNDYGQLIWDRQFGGTYVSFNYWGKLFFMQDTLYARVPHNSFYSVNPSNGQPHNLISGSNFTCNDSTILMSEIYSWPPPVNYNLFYVYDVSSGVKIPLYTDTIFTNSNYALAKFLVPKSWGFYFANGYKFGRYNYTSTSNEEINDKSGIKVYPNPSYGNITVEGIESDSRIYAYDELGRLLKVKIRNEGTYTMITFQENYIGLAYLKILSKNSIKNYKLVVTQ